MYLYAVGYESHEDSASIEIWHERHFSKEEFEGMVVDACPGAVREVKEDDGFLHNFTDIYEEVVAILIRDHGFVKVKYEVRVYPFGWPSIFIRDWGNDPDPLLDRIRERLAAEGFTVEDDDINSTRAREEMDELVAEARRKEATMNIEDALEMVKELNIKETANFKTMMSLRERLIDEGLSRIVVDRVIGRVAIDVTDAGAAREPEPLEAYVEICAVTIAKIFRALQDVDDIASPADVLVDMVSRMEIELK